MTDLPYRTASAATMQALSNRRRVRAAAATHVGLVRDRNEDSLGIAGWSACGSNHVEVCGTFEAPEPLVTLVADGLGGHAAGDVASRRAVDFLMTNASNLVEAAAVEVVLRQADALISAEGARRGETANMGSTVAGVVLVGTQVHVFNVGDSSVWRVVDGYAGILSRDDRPPLAPGQPAGPVVRAVGQCLGGGGIGSLMPHVRTIEIEQGDRFVIASDGLTDLVDIERIGGTGAGTLEGTARALIDAALGAGGYDNISVIVLDV